MLLLTIIVGWTGLVVSVGRLVASRLIVQIGHAETVESQKAQLCFQEFVDSDCTNSLLLEYCYK